MEETIEKDEMFDKQFYLMDPPRNCKIVDVEDNGFQKEYEEFDSYINMKNILNDTPKIVHRSTKRDDELKENSVLDDVEVADLTKQYKKCLSGYAFESVDEFVAESIAEYMNGKCRPLARQVVEVLIRGR